jgi:hypothetical protein
MVTVSGLHHSGSPLAARGGWMSQAGVKQGPCKERGQ